MSTPFYDLASLVVVPSGYKASKVYAQKPLTTDGQLAFTRSTTATRVNSAGLIESVAINVPRLDYLNSTCPKLQLEPQRSNIVLYSSDYTVGAWTKNAGATITANTVASPDGTTNATTLTVSTTIYSGLYQAISGTAAAHTVSFFAKKGTKNWLYLFDATAAGQAWFNLDTGTLGTVQSGRTATIENYGNGWYRCSVTRTAGGSIAYMQLGLSDGDGFSQPTSTGTAYLWGAQVEEGAYPTSIIPTTTAAVTRNADACSKTGISSLIGQTEGTLFLDFTIGRTPASTDRVAILSDGTGSERIGISVGGTGLLYMFVVDGGATQAEIIRTSTTAGTYKVAAAYKANDFVFYVNGVQVGTDTSGSIPSCSRLDIGNQLNDDILGGGVNQALLFKTRLTNAQLAELTTI